MEPFFFAKLFGLYFIIVGVIVLMRRKALMSAITEMAGNRALLVLFGFIELVAGLALVLAYPKMTMDWVGLITLVGWMMMIEGILYIVLSARATKRFIGYFNRPNWYIAGSILSILMGVYLAGKGFLLF